MTNAKKPVNNNEGNYLSLLEEVLENGRVAETRTGIPARSIKGAMRVYDLRENFPLLTTKKVFWKGVVEELLWFLRGETNVTSLRKAGVRIWDEWADGKGELGPVYGAQWRKWRYSDARGNQHRVDQIGRAIRILKEIPDSRQNVVSAWNAAQVHEMALPPCHTMFHLMTEKLTLVERCNLIGADADANDVQALLDEKGVPTHALSLALYQRSADLFLGVPFNIASYALLLTMLAQEANMVPLEFIHFMGDAHIYENHVEQVKTQLARKARPGPTVTVANKPFDQITAEDIALDGYKPQAAIKGEVAV